MSSKLNVLLNNHTRNKIVIIFNVFITIHLSAQHFVMPPAECILSKTCNHTWDPVCGQNKHDLAKRLFLDECDMHEYNCDNNKAYIIVEVNVCPQKCTEKGHQHAQIHKTEDTTIATSPMNTLASTSEETTLTIHYNNTETTTDIVFTTLEEPSTYSETTIESTTETDMSETTILGNSSTEITEIPTDAGEVTTEITHEVTDTTIDTEFTTDVSETATESDVPTSTNITVNITQEVEDKQTTATELEEYIETTLVNNDENTIPPSIEDTTNPSESNNSMSSSTQLSCHSYPKGCFVPSTWETTPSNETRDFFQVLKERYGDNIKLLRHTTHFPRRAMFKPLDE